MKIQSTRLIRSTKPIANQFNSKTLTNPDVLVSIDPHLFKDASISDQATHSKPTEIAPDQMAQTPHPIRSESGDELELFTKKRKQKIKYAGAGLKLADTTATRLGLEHSLHVGQSLGVLSLTLSAVKLAYELDEDEWGADLAIAGVDTMSSMLHLFSTAYPQLKPFAQAANEVSVVLTFANESYGMFTGKT